MTFSDDLKAKLKDADIEKHLHTFIDEAGQFVDSSVGKAGEVAHDKRDDVQAWLDKASAGVNEKTKGQYASQVSKIKDAVLSGLDKLAEKRPDAADPKAALDAPETATKPAEPPVEG